MVVRGRGGLVGGMVGFFYFFFFDVVSWGLRFVWDAIGFWVLRVCADGCGVFRDARQCLCYCEDRVLVSDGGLSKLLDFRG